MSSRSIAVVAELLQLVPIVSFALPIIMSGEVDLKHAGAAFLLAALLTIPTFAFVIAKRQLVNPILVGVAFWLWLGAASFNVPVPSVANWIASIQGFGLFLAVLGAGITATLAAPNGYVACRTNDDGWRRRASLGLLALTIGAVAWSWFFRSDIRVGGGLPFIVLNVSRRFIGKRAPQLVAQGT